MCHPVPGDLQIFFPGISEVSKIGSFHEFQKKILYRFTESINDLSLGTAYGTSLAVLSVYMLLQRRCVGVERLQDWSDILMPECLDCENFWTAERFGTETFLRIEH